MRFSYLYSFSVILSSERKVIFMSDKRLKIQNTPHSSWSVSPKTLVKRNIPVSKHELHRENQRTLPVGTPSVVVVVLTLNTETTWLLTGSSLAFWQKWLANINRSSSSREEECEEEQKALWLCTQKTTLVLNLLTPYTRYNTELKSLISLTL